MIATGAVVCYCKQNKFIVSCRNDDDTKAEGRGGAEQVTSFGLWSSNNEKRGRKRESENCDTKRRAQKYGRLSSYQFQRVPAREGIGTSIG
jgi:hypothetical protein